jgi:hypothetical protein
MAVSDHQRRAIDVSTFGGSWEVVINTPIGDLTAVFEIIEKDGAIKGTARTDDETVDFLEPVADGNRLTWTQEVTTPMQLKLNFDVTVEGDTMTGTSKAVGMPIPASKVTGSRTAAG